MGTVKFLVESLKNFRTVGALAACSPIAAGKMTRPVDFSRATLLVELGGGTGVVTKEILAKMRPDAELIVFEINPSFTKTLQALKDSRLTIINDSALTLGRYLVTRGISKVDCIISTLPLAIMDRVTRGEVLKEVTAALEPDGRYVQIQYSLASKREIKGTFSTVLMDFTPFNFPPAFFYICER